MPDVRILPSRKDSLASVIASGIQGYQAGRQNKFLMDQKSLADMKAMVELQKLQAETQGLKAPVPAPDYFRDPSSGKLYPKDPYRGRGTTVNLPFQFDAGQKDDSGGAIFNSPEEADSSGLPAGTVVMVINPATGEPEEYEV